MSQDPLKESVYVGIEGEHVRGLTKISLLAPWIHKIDFSSIMFESHVNPYTASILPAKA
jgi:hypothetical protein